MDRYGSQKGHGYKYGMYGSTKQKFKLGIRTRFDIRSNFFVYSNVGRGTINPVSVSNFEKGAEKKKPGCLIWVEPFCITDGFSGYSHKLKELAGRTYPSEDCIEWIDKMKISGGATALETFTPKFNQHIYCRGIGMVYWRMGSRITKLADYYIPGREQTRILLKRQGAIPFGTKIENREIR